MAEPEAEVPPAVPADPPAVPADLPAEPAATEPSLESTAAPTEEKTSNENTEESPTIATVTNTQAISAASTLISGASGAQGPINCEESIICQYENCKGVYEKPTFLTCCGESVCQQHLDKLYTDPEKTKIKCCFCGQEFSKPEKGLTINKGIEKLINIDLGEDQRDAKASLSSMSEKITKYNQMKNEPDNFIHDYFEDIKKKINEKRDEKKKSLDDYFDSLIKEIDGYEEESKSNKKNVNEMIDKNLEKFNNQYKKWDTETKKFIVNDSKWQSLNKEIKQSKNEIENKYKEVQSMLLNSKVYEYKEPFTSINNEDAYGKIFINDNPVIKDFDLISASYDSTIMKWNIDSATADKTFYKHSDLVFCIKLLSSDRLLSSTKDKKINLFNLITEERIKTYDCKGSFALTLVKLQDQEGFGSGHPNGKILIWNIDEEQPIETLIGHSTPIRALEFVKDKNVLVSSSAMEVIKLWDLEKYECIKTINDPANSVSTIRLVPNKFELLVGLKDGKIKKLNLSTFSSTESFQPFEKEIYKIEFIRDGKVAVSSLDNQIKIWDLSKNTLLGTLSGHKDKIEDLKFLPSDRLLSCSCDKTIKIWDLSSFECLHTLEGHKEWVKCLELIEKL